MQSKGYEVVAENPGGTAHFPPQLRRRKESLNEDNGTIATGRTLWSMNFQNVSPDKSSQKTISFSNTVRTASVANNLHVSFTRCMNVSRLQPMIVDKLSKIRCVDICRLLSIGNQWLIQLLTVRSPIRNFYCCCFSKQRSGQYKSWALVSDDLCQLSLRTVDAI
jgi:hypothetical protein